MQIANALLVAGAKFARMKTFVRSCATAFFSLTPGKDAARLKTLLFRSFEARVRYCEAEAIKKMAEAEKECVQTEFLRRILLYRATIPVSDDLPDAINNAAHLTERPEETSRRSSTHPGDDQFRPPASH